MLQIFWKNAEISHIFCKILEFFAKLLQVCLRENDIRVELEKCWKMLKNAYLDPKIVVDPAENELRKEWWCRGPCMDSDERPDGLSSTDISSGMAAAERRMFRMRTLRSLGGIPCRCGGID